MVEIRPGTLRDISFVAANLRAEDSEEIFATAMLESTVQAAALSFMASGEHCWTAWIGDQPHAAFGVAYTSPLTPHLRSAWAWGTGKFKRCVPAITRFAKREWPALFIGQGVTRIEIRSLEGHDLAHKWLKSLGAHHEADMPAYGVNGETFELWSLLKEDFDNVLFV